MSYQGSRPHSPCHTQKKGMRWGKESVLLVLIGRLLVVQMNSVSPWEPEIGNKAQRDNPVLNDIS